MCQCPLGLLPHFYVAFWQNSYQIRCLCQCPLGLLPHFYHKYWSDEMCRYYECQCPLGLLPHFYFIMADRHVRLMIHKCQCPLGLLPHFYVVSPPKQKGRKEFVSMPSRAVTSFLQYPFKNLGFMRLPEPVFAGIYQNILTTAVFRAC